MRLLIVFLILLAIVPLVNADTLLIETGVDGRASEDSDGTYSTIRGDVGDGYDSTSSTLGAYIRLSATTTENQFSSLYRGIVSYNTSDIPDDATIDSAIFSLYYSTKANPLGSPDVGITGGTLISNTAIAAGDYDGYSSTRYATDISYAGITGRVNWTLNAAGLSAISKTGYTVFYVRDSWDIDNSFGGTWVSGQGNYIVFRPFEYATTTQRPFLQIVYTPAAGGDTTSPASISGLTNSTTCNAINWTWGNPTDADFNHTVIYKDGSWLKNVSNTTTFDLWGSLTEMTTYTFGSKTCDITGNCNTTFVNQSATTGACGSAPVAAFSANNLTICAGTNTQFTDESINTPTSWYWDFGDGNSSTSQNPLKTYDVLGLMHVNLTATNTYGSDSELKIDYINVTECAPSGDPPVADFSSDKSGSICNGEYIQFTDESTNTPTSWYWIFGDGNTSTSQNPTFQFNVLGDYHVKLNASNEWGFSWHNETIDHYLVNDCTPEPTQTPITHPIRQDRGQMIDLITWILNLFRSKLV